MTLSNPVRTPKQKLIAALLAALAAFVGYLVQEFAPGPPPPDPPPDEPRAFGWVRDPAAVQDVVSRLPVPEFRATEAYTAPYTGPDDVFLWDACRKVTGDLLPPRDQKSVGSCVSFGTASAIEHLICVQIATGERAEFRDLAQEVIYGGSRVEVGGGRIGGDGSVGAWAAKFVQDWGVVARGVHGSHDLTRYDEGRCREYGRRGVPPDLEALAREHPVKTVTNVKSWDECRAAVRNGYPVAVCSDQGFTMARDADGFCRPSGRWAHCVPYGTMISTLIPKPCQDVAVGDEVVGHDGRLHPVSRVFTRPFDGDLVVLDTYGMVPTRFTPNHPVLVYRRMPADGTAFAPGLDLAVYAGGKYARLVPRYESWQTGQPVWVAAEDVRPGDYLLSPVLRTEPGTPELPEWAAGSAHARNIPRWPPTPPDDVPWLLGLYIADGNATAGHRVSIVVGREQAATVARAVRAWAALGLTARVEESATFTRVIVDSAVAANSFRRWFGTSSADKHIPEFLYRGWNLRALIDGILDGDGCDHRGGHVVTTTSNRLALQLHQLLLSLGERPSMKHQPRNGGEFPNAAPAWTVAWLPGQTKPVMRHWNGFYLMPVRSVTPERYAGLVWNYEVDEAHSYLSNNIISHNCMAIVGVKGKPREGAFILNSWGGSAHTGPTGAGDPSPAGFWADAAVVDRMLRQGDSWAFSGFVGFPARKLDWYAGRRPPPGAARLALLPTDRRLP